MMQRIASVLVLAVALVACKDDGNGPGGGKPVGATLFRGIGDVRVIDARLVPSGDSAAGISAGTITYVIARIEFTNDLGYDTTPSIDHFYLIDTSGNRLQGKDGGSQVFVGVSNSQMVLKQNEKREYTVGFRSNDPNIQGTIEYDR